VTAWLELPVVQLVVALVAGGLGVPLPEELALVGAGYAIYGGSDAPTLVVAALLAVLAGDLTLYALGRGGARLGWVRRALGSRRRERLTQAFARHGAKLVLVGRFVPGLRSAMLLCAGAGHMPLLRLAAWDALGACASVALWISVGVRLGPHLERAQAMVDDGRTALLIVAAVGGGVYWLVKQMRGRRSVAGS
jgi:membrane protein DedA with SNARE-associated domain